MTWKPDMMIYHAHCADGFGAAWAAWMRWRDEVRYIPVAYGEAPPDVAGKHVLIGDFSFKKDVLEEMGRSAASVVILDHHKTAQADLEDFAIEARGIGAFSPDDVASVLGLAGRHGVPTILASFDMERSGARMVWDFCHGTEAPLLILLIEDRDLWRFEIEETKPFGLWLRSEPFDFDRWELLSQQLNDGRDAHDIMTEAKAMQRFFDQKVVEMARLSRIGRVGSEMVPVVNCPPMFASEVCHQLLQDHPEAPFVACYADQGNARGYSLRSEDGRQDVSAIAKKFGGGGHRNAAGFGVPLP